MEGMYLTSQTLMRLGVGEPHILKSVFEKKEVPSIAFEEGMGDQRSPFKYVRTRIKERTEIFIGENRVAPHKAAD